MLKLGRITKDKVLSLVLVYVFNFDLFEFSAAILEKGLLEIDYSRAPCLGADQKARGLWERDWISTGKEKKTSH